MKFSLARLIGAGLRAWFAPDGPGRKLSALWSVAAVFLAALLAAMKTHSLTAAMPVLEPLAWTLMAVATGQTLTQGLVKDRLGKPASTVVPEVVPSREPLP